jgi:tetratricopeptide (TPR) repeat protein
VRNQEKALARTCFVVRPFGKKTFRAKKASADNDAPSAYEDIEVNFDEIHEALIVPAMERAGLVGGTTASHKEAGNIRTDMFDGLASADIVIADISIQNANVYYELGARHGLRDKRTVMIRFRGDDTPFDIKTDRYLVYDRDAPEESIDNLVESLEATLEGNQVDSPIYDLLDGLRPSDPSALALVPVEFRHAVERARTDERPGRLELLGEEAGYYAWANGGLRLVGEAQFKLKQYEGARESWETLAERTDGDVEAYLTLATVKERLGDLTGSDQALEKALAMGDLSVHQQAEAEALLGRNAKTLWKGQWDQIEDVEEKRLAALKSRYLSEARERYRSGFEADLNHHFSGINALGLMSITKSLAAAFPNAWNSLYRKNRDAEYALDDLSDEMQNLAGAVTLAVERHRTTASDQPDDPRWAELSLAEVHLLAGDDAQRVANAYSSALEGADGFFFDSAGNQLIMYDELGVATDVIAAIREQVPGLRPENLRKPAKKKEQRVILFSGHRLDAPGREIPRFPRDKEPEARAAIKAKVEGVLGNHPDAEFTAMAGGANGGDILFHEVCEELGVPTELYLAVPSSDYARLSVIVEEQPQWKDRYEVIRKRCDEGKCTWQLQDDEKLPTWMGARRDRYSVWERNNLWVLYSALAQGGGPGTDVILLWDGEEGDGPGGTRHMREVTKRRGASTHIILTKKVFGLE